MKQLNRDYDYEIIEDETYVYENKNGDTDFDDVMVLSECYVLNRLPKGKVKYQLFLIEKDVFDEVAPTMIQQKQNESVDFETGEIHLYQSDNKHYLVKII